MGKPKVVFGMKDKENNKFNQQMNKNFKSVNFLKMKKKFMRNIIKQEAK